MGSAEKLLRAMLADANPTSYTYDDAVRVLENLGFHPARTKPKGSHRLWRLEVADGTRTRSIYVGLVDKGHGQLKSVYIRTMLEVLIENELANREE